MSGRRRRTDAAGGRRHRPEFDIVDALDQEAQVATLVGADDATSGQHGSSLRSDRRAARRAEQERWRQIRLGSLAVAAVVLLVLVVIAVRTVTSDDDDAATGATSSSDPSTRTSVLVQLTGAEETAEAAALLSWDAGAGTGGAFTIPAGLLVDVDGLGQLPLADALPDAGAEQSAHAFAASIGADMSGSWVLDESALSALVEEVGGITVNVDVDVTEQGGDGSSAVVVPAGSQQLDGTKAAAFASFRQEGEDAFVQTARFGEVLQAAIRGLPQGEEAVGAILVELGGGSTSTLDEAALARMLSDLAQATAAGQVTWKVLPTAVGPSAGTLIVDSAALDPLLVEAGLTG